MSEAWGHSGPDVNAAASLRREIAELRATQAELLAALRSCEEQLKNRWGFADAPYDPDALELLANVTAAIARAEGK